MKSALFLEAQAPVYAGVVEELRNGRKVTHWMWFVFPQIAGLGSSEMARRFALHGIDDARAYVAHPVLGHRLRECTRLVLAHSNRSANEIFGSTDEMKFRSSMTLFDRADPTITLFRAAIGRFFDGRPDRATLKLLAVR